MPVIRVKILIQVGDQGRWRISKSVSSLCLMISNNDVNVHFTILIWLLNVIINLHNF